MRKYENEPQAMRTEHQRGPFKKTRAGEELTREQIREINEGRKRLKKEMRRQRIYSKREFELTASSMGLYYDDIKGLGLLMWLFHGRTMGALLGAISALLAVMYLFSTVSQRAGHFTVNMTDNMFMDGFVLSEDKTFENPTSTLYSEKVENVPCISISTIPEDVDYQDGDHSGDNYFAYTFYVKYEGSDEDAMANYEYEVNINSESQNVGGAAWLMLFEDGRQTFYARQTEDGEVEAIPALDDDSRGYREMAHMAQAKYPDEQYQVVGSSGHGTFYRVLPVPFASETVMAYGHQENVRSGDIHKYTIVLWLEGDDPDCTDDLIGGHIGIEMNFKLLDIDDDSATGFDKFAEDIKAIWKSLTPWGD